jgi:glycosyltransferase involved in cell wall biosynthesis
MMEVQEKYISKAIEGILFQNLPLEYEIILADDCSSDKTSGIAKNYKLKNNMYKKEYSFL